MPDFSNLGQTPENQGTGAEPSTEEPASEALPPLDFDEEEGEALSSGDMPGQAEDKEESSGDDEDAEEEEDGEPEGEDQDEELTGQKKAGEYISTIPQVNMLANIIRWFPMLKKRSDRPNYRFSWMSMPLPAV